MIDTGHYLFIKIEITLIAWKQELMKIHERTPYQRNLFFFNIEFLAEKKKPKISKSRPYALYSVPPTSPPMFSTDLIMWKTVEIHCTEDFVVPFAPLVSHREWNLPCRKMKGISELMWTFKTIANLIGLGGPLFPLFFKSYFIMFTLLQLRTPLILP